MKKADIVPIAGRLDLKTLEAAIKAIRKRVTEPASGDIREGLRRAIDTLENLELENLERGQK